MSKIHKAKFTFEKSLQDYIKELDVKCSCKINSTDILNHLHEDSCEMKELISWWKTEARIMYRECFKGESGKVLIVE